MYSSTTLGELLASTGGSIKTGPFGTTLKAAEYSSSGVPLISVGEVGYGTIRLSEKTPRVDARIVDRLPAYILREGDLVFGRKGAVDRSAWVRPHEDGYFLGSDGIRVRFGEGVDSRFMAYQLQSSTSRDWLLQHASGTTMLSLNQKILERVPIVVPDYDVQQAIADVLGALDDKIAINDQALRLCVELTDSKFAHAVSGIQPSDKTFGDIAKVGGGGTPKTSVEEYWNGSIPWATPTDVTALSGPYLFSTGRTITQAGLDSCSSAVYPKGSILMTSRATIGAFAIAHSPVAVNQGFIVVNARDPRYQLWLFHEMRARVAEFVSHANGATFLELSRGKFKQFRVRTPDAEQAHRFSREVEELHALASQMIIESTNIANARDELLPLLMSGRICVRDAEKTVEGVV
ncbi:restriction endonuclease subunit S [Saccharomonospora xinjiangensis]|uniref:restriction endonuclease subunit S n=1 Tax=Saccharomonospora xinjiangensis TaxID=75294 RepID=UPI0035105AEC